MDALDECTLKREKFDPSDLLAMTREGLGFIRLGAANLAFQTM